MAASLKTFLNSRRAAADDTGSHVMFGAEQGKWRVAPDDEAKLLELHHAALAEGPLSLCEMPLTDALPLIIDFDLVAAARPEGRLWGDGDMTILGDFCLSLRECYSIIYELDVEALNFFVFVRDEGYTKKDGSWSDGLHIMCPQLRMDARAHQIVRNIALWLYNGGLKKELGFHSSVVTPDAAVWDASTSSGKQPWFIYGAGKAGTQPYKLRAIYSLNDSVGEGTWSEEAEVAEIEQSMILPRLLSMRLDEVFAGRNPLRVREGYDLDAELAQGFAAIAEGEADAAQPSVPLETVVELLGLLSTERAVRRGFARGEEGCGEVLQCVFRLVGEAGREAALAFAQRSERHWTGAAAAEARTWFRTAFKSSAYARGLNALRAWAKADSPEAYATWAARQPRSLTGPAPELSPERIKALIRETTALTLPAERILDKAGQPFSARFLYGTGEAAAAAGLNSLDAMTGTVIIRSHLGTGKTTLFRALAGQHRTILYISARRSFTRSMLAEFNTDGLGFRSYMGCEAVCPRDCDSELHVPWSFSLSDGRCSRLFVQVESLHRFTGDNAYDLLVLDESESVLAALSPGPTQRTNLLQNVIQFQKLVSSAKVVVAGDAFVSDRTMAVLSALRPATPESYASGALVPGRSLPRLLNNTLNPYTNRTAERIQFLNPNGTESLVKGKALFHKRIEKELTAGKRLVIVSASYQEFADLRENLFGSPEFRAKFPAFVGKFYSGKDEDRDARNRDLEDVNAAWEPANVLLYTPTITVGINYTGKPFDIMFLYGSRMGPTVRDMFQASLRCRELASNHCVFFLSHRGGSAFPVGSGAIKQNFRDVAASASMMRRRVLEEATQAREAVLGQGGPATTKLALAREVLLDELPPWFVELLVRNQNEAAVSQSCPTELYSHFFAECGYTCPTGCSIEHEHKVLRNFARLDEDGLDVPKFEQVLPYADVATLPEGSVELAEVQQRLQEDTGVLTNADRLAVAKFKFRRRCGILGAGLPLWRADVGPFDDETEAHRALEKALVARYKCATSEEDSVAYAEICRLSARIDEIEAANDAKLAATKQPFPDWATPENLEELWSGASGFAVGGVSQFFHVALEKMPPADGLEAAHRIDAKNSFGFTLLAKDGLLAPQLLVLRAMLEVLGLEHSCAERTWSDAEWRALLPAFAAEREWPDAPEGEFRRCSLLKRLSAVFQLRHWRSHDENATIHLAHTRLKEDVTQVLSRWSGATIKATKVAGMARVGAAAVAGWEGQATEQELKATWRAEFRENPNFAPLEVFAAAEVPGKSPAKLRSQAIEAAIGARWREWKAAQGVGGREDAYEYRSVPVPNLWVAVAAESVRTTTEEAQNE